MLGKCVLKSYLILPFSGKTPTFSYFLVEIILLFDENSYFFLLFWPVLLLDALIVSLWSNMTRSDIVTDYLTRPSRYCVVHNLVWYDGRYNNR